MSSSRMDNGWLKWTMFLSCWLRALQSVSASELNITVVNTDPSVFYHPPEAWHTSSILCSDTISSGAAGFYLSSCSMVRSQFRHTDRKSRSSKLSPEEITSAPTSDRHGKNDNDRKARGLSRLAECAGVKGSVERRGVHCADENTAPSIRFDFIGTAIYVYGFLPSSSVAESTPRHSVTFSIDGTDGRETSSPAESSAVIFAQRGLADGPHSLRVSLGETAQFALYYLQYTPTRRNPNFLHVRQEPSASPTVLSTSTSTTTTPPSSSSAQPNKKRNITTFAAAVGGSVGVLALLSLGLAISIIRRRRLAAKRERLEREDPEYLLRQQQQLGMAQTGSNDIVFIPRYFPGTEIPPQPSALSPGDLPPPYTPPVAPPNIANHYDVATRGTGRSASNTVAQNPAFTYALPPFHPPMRSPYLHHPPPRPSDSPDLTYADIPPDSPPPPPSPELPLQRIPSPASPANTVPEPRRPTHVSVAVGHEQEHDPPLPPGIVDAVPQRAVCRGQSSAENHQVQRHQRRSNVTSLEHARATLSSSNDDDEDISDSGHSSEQAGSKPPSAGEFLPLLASPAATATTTSSADAHRNSPPWRGRSSQPVV